MSIYIDHEFEATTLAVIEQEAVRIARETWYREIEWHVEVSFRDMAINDVRAGNTVPQDWPMFSPAVFEKSLFDLDDSKATLTWGQKIAEELSSRPLFMISGHTSD